MCKIFCRFNLNERICYLTWYSCDHDDDDDNVNFKTKMIIIWYWCYEQENQTKPNKKKSNKNYKASEQGRGKLIIGMNEFHHPIKNNVMRYNLIIEWIDRIFVFFFFAIDRIMNIYRRLNT